MSSPSRRERPVGRDSAGVRCPQCGASRLVQRHCKVICEACGYVESCEDNFPETARAVGGRHD